jgi:hypothetical protein
MIDHLDWTKENYQLIINTCLTSYMTQRNKAIWVWTCSLVLTSERRMKYQIGFLG